jgi:dienelactone hydrolase
MIAIPRGPTIRRFLVGAALFLAGACYGGGAVRYGLFPYPQLQWRFHQLARARNPSPLAPRADLSLMTVRSAADVQRRRRELVRLIWGRDSLPSRLPDSVETGIHDRRFSALPNLARIDRLRVRMDFGLDSKILHFVPARANGGLVLVHDGHVAATTLGDLVARLLERGYAVASFSMPLGGDNERPTIRAGQLGRVVLDNHDKLRLLAPPAGLAEQYLLEPVPVALNHLLSSSRYREVAMVGLSGGGWTTALAAALDPRIAASVSVAGSSPPDIARGAWHDFEQTDPALYTRISYLDLYVLGAAGQGRRQLQILNEYDPCCFAGRAAETYRAAVAHRARRLGGRFDLLIDSSHEEHRISDWAMERILSELSLSEPRAARAP